MSNHNNRNTVDANNKNISNANTQKSDALQEKNDANALTNSVKETEQEKNARLNNEKLINDKNAEIARKKKEEADFLDSYQKEAEAEAIAKACKTVKAKFDAIKKAREKENNKTAKQYISIKNIDDVDINKIIENISDVVKMNNIKTEVNKEIEKRDGTFSLNENLTSVLQNLSKTLSNAVAGKLICEIRNKDKSQTLLDLEADIEKKKIESLEKKEVHEGTVSAGFETAEKITNDNIK